MRVLRWPSLLVLLTWLACGPTTRTPVAPVAPPPTPPPAPLATHATTAGDAGGPVDAKQACDRVFELKQSGCASLQGYDLSHDECVENLRKSLEDRGPDARAAATSIGRCYMGSTDCDATDACVQAAMHAMGVPDKTPLRACADTSVYGAVGYPRDQWERRKGAVSSHFSQVSSTKDAPIEVCGIPAEGEWLARVTCDDGSNPFHSPEQAEPARVGNVGPGGRCGAIVDLYEVACPEKTYEVYLDAYVCPLE